MGCKRAETVWKQRNRLRSCKYMASSQDPGRRAMVSAAQLDGWDIILYVSTQCTTSNDKCGRKGQDRVWHHQARLSGVESYLRSARRAAQGRPFWKEETGAYRILHRATASFDRRIMSAQKLVLLGLLSLLLLKTRSVFYFCF